MRPPTCGIATTATLAGLNDWAWNRRVLVERQVRRWARMSVNSSIQEVSRDRRILKEAGVKAGASWFVAERAEEVKGASSMPLAKAMDDCLVCYGMNGEAVRPQQGFPLRLMVPGFEGIFATKYLRRIKVVDRYYMNYNDYGHLRRDPKETALSYQVGPKSVITFPSGGTTAARPRILRDQRLGLVRWESRAQGGGINRRRPALEGGRNSGDGISHGAYPVQLSLELGRTIPFLIVLFYRPPGLADDDGAGALGACGVPLHAQVDFA
jgi:hypothetical protein